MRIQLLILLCLSALPPCLAQTIALRTTVRDVVVQANAQQTGTIVFVVSGEAFIGATPESPVYIRILFDKNALLCRTLVWTSEANPDPITRTPIYLPVRFENSDANNNITPESAGAISIARWKAGESSIWLKATQPAENFVTTFLDGDNRVSFGLGFSARTYWEENQSAFIVGQANMPSSTRDPSDPLALTQADSVSTLICMDYRQSTLVARPSQTPIQTIGNFNLSLLGSTTRGVDGPSAAANEADIIQGDLIRPGFSADNPISIGNASLCFVNLSNEDIVIGESQLCTDGLKSFTSSRVLQISCSNSWGFHQGSEVTISLTDEGQNGFRVQTDGQGTPLQDEQGRVLLFAEDFVFGIDSNPPPIAYCNADDIFLATGNHWLSRQVTLVYDGPNTLGGISLTVSTTIYQDAAAGPATVQATKHFRVANREPADTLDVAPFDHPQEQHRRCPPALREVTLSQDVLLGEFKICGPGGTP